MQHQLKCMPNNDVMGAVHHTHEQHRLQSASNQPLEPSMHMSPLSLSGVQCAHSLIPRPSTPPVFDRLQYAKMEGEAQCTETQQAKLQCEVKRETL